MIVVTGGAGFIGSNLVARLVADGADVVVVDRLGSGEKWKNLLGKPVRDIVSPDAVDAFRTAHRRDITAVYHLGANSSTRSTDGDGVLKTNVRASFDWFDWCADGEVPLVYASSAATYGDGASGFVDDDDLAALNRLRPLNLYGWSKHVADLRFVDARRKGRPCPPSWYGLKFFNVYGPNEYHKGPMISAVVPFFQNLRAGRPVSLFKSLRADIPDGEQKRDFVHVDDVVDVMLWAMETRPPSGIYNVGSGVARSYLSLVDAVAVALGRVPEVAFVDMPEDLRARYQYETRASLKRLTEAGWRGTFRSIEEGVGSYVRDVLVPGAYR